MHSFIDAEDSFMFDAFESTVYLEMVPKQSSFLSSVILASNRPRSAKLAEYRFRMHIPTLKTHL